MSTEPVVEPVVEAPAPQPLQSAEQQPAVSEHNGLTVITAGDHAEAAKELEAQAPRLRKNAKPRVSAPLMDAPSAAGDAAAAVTAETSTAPKPRPKALQPGGERFEEAQRQKKALFDENTRLKAELDAARKPAAAAPAAIAEAAPDKFPSQDQWFAAHPDKTFDDFLDARDDWRDTRKTQVSQQTQAQQQMQERATADWTRYVTDAQTLENFDQVVSEGLAQVPLRPELQIAILQAPHSARIAYYLATHPEIAQDLARLPIVDLYREVGALDAQFRSKPVGTTATVIRSTAPAPFQPTGAGAAVQSTESFFDTAAKIGSKTKGTLAEYEALRRSHGMVGGRRRM